LDADFDFGFPYDEYCKCGSGTCNGNSRTHPYNESWDTSEKIIALLEEVEPTEDESQKLGTEWISNLKNKMQDELAEVLLELLKDGIDPFLIPYNKYGWYKVKNSLRAKMNTSLNKIKQQNANLFPEKFFDKIRDIDHYDLISEILDEELTSYSRFVPSYYMEEDSHKTSCGRCGICLRCIEYSVNIRKAINEIGDSYQDPAYDMSFYSKYSQFTGLKYSWCSSLIKTISLDIIHIIKLNFFSLGTKQFAWIRNLPGKDHLLFKEVKEDNVDSYYDEIYDYVTVTLMYINNRIESERYANKTTSEFEKANLIEDLFSYRDPYRFIPLYRVTNAYEEHLLKGRMNNPDVVEKLVIVGGPRIFGLSVIIEDILRDRNDPLLPLWEELNFCIANDKFFIAQSCISNILGLVRDNRCIAQIKNISRDIDKESFIESFSGLVDSLGYYADSASVFVLPFIKTAKLSPSDRATSLNRNGTVHGGIDYFSKFNSLGMLIILTNVFIDMYAFDEDDPDSIHPMFKPKNEWKG
jgi:hypothetical protein